MAWSPDNSEIAFLQYVGDTNVMIGNRAIEKTKPNFNIDLPDSHPVYWKAKNEAFVKINVRTGETKEITRGAALFGNIIWDSNGILRLMESGMETKSRYYNRNGDEIKIKVASKRIVRPDKHFDLYVINDDGSNKEYLTTGGGYYGSRLSPDGRKILACKGGFIIIDVETRKIGKLNVKGDGGWWKPDGKGIIYEDTQYGGPDGGMLITSDIYMIDIDGRNKSRLTFEPEKKYMEPSISPDGSKVLLLSEKEEKVYIGKLEEN